jgi:hypothetical protein
MIRAVWRCANSQAFSSDRPSSAMSSRGAMAIDSGLSNAMIA